MPYSLYAPFEVHTLQSKLAGKIAYLDEGEGEQTILFIHGLSNYALGWVKNLTALSKKYRCIALDLPGNGLSERGQYQYSLHFFAAVIEDFINQLYLKQLSICGHSMGCQIAITLLLHRPEIANKLILCAPAGFEEFSPWEMSMYEATLHVVDVFSSEENSLRKSIRASFYKHQGDADRMINDLIKLMHQHSIKDYRKMVEACIRGMLHEPVYNSLHLLEQPALVLFGERDALIPNKVLHPVTTRDVGEKGVKQLKKGRLEMISQCGHFVQWEQAGMVNRLIDEFLQQPQA